MAAIGKATVQINVEGSHIRLRALEIAIESFPQAAEEEIIRRAAKYAAFISDGTTEATN